MNYKTTLNMPKTSFEMKANLKVKEPLIQQMWRDLKIEEEVYKKNKNKPFFTLHDGPPYANGYLHVGHALNKILKDIIVRYKNMDGFLSIFIAGWDTHGMPIEVALSKKGKNKDPNLSIVDKRINCSNFALNWIENQKDQFLKIGIMTSMDNIYKTLDLDFEIAQLKIFNKMLLSNLIFQDLKPIYWSWSSRTALAEAEVEYQNVQSNSIYVGFDVLKSQVLEKGDKLLIWTTTPWTIPSNLAIAVKADIEYVRVKTKKAIIICSGNNLDKIMKIIRESQYKIISKHKGKDFLETTYKHPLYAREGIIINDDYVSNTDGTGLVHNAPGFGNEDYIACKKYNIKPFCPIDEFGKFTNEINDSEIEGLFYDETNENIINRLNKTNNLFNNEKITHSIAHDWRTKKPLIYRATKQWFVNISKINKNINQELDKVRSPQGDVIINRIREMINNRPEWCISRQRYWGVPIIIIYDQDKKPIISEELQNHILDILKEEGINSWFLNDVYHFLPSGYDKTKKFYKEKDIMDVWFDSGSTHNILGLNNLPYPADLYFEGKDQFRGWFNSSLITGIAYHGKAPYKSLLSHGFVLDKSGRKMSKSLGNIIDPIKVCNEYGADVLRIWVASSDYSDDIKIFPELLVQNSEIYRRIRNTIFKFILGNLHDFDLNEKVNYSKVDKHILGRLSVEIKKVKLLYAIYDFKNIIKNMNEFAIELSAWYFDYIKDSLYCNELDNPHRRAIQNVLFKIINAYLIIMNPIIPHTCEEAYQLLNQKNKKQSIQLEEFKSIDIEEEDGKESKNWSIFFELKNLIYSKLEDARAMKIINKNNEALVFIEAPKICFNEIELAPLLNVSEVIFKKNKELKIRIEKTKNNKCLRCWNYFNSQKMFNEEICIRCSDVIKGLPLDILK